MAKVTPRNKVRFAWWAAEEELGDAREIIILVAVIARNVII
jgi:hypothetical protein